MITVYGGGSWGTALGSLLAGSGHDVTMLLRDERVARAINEKHENPRYLPGIALAPGLRATTDPEILGQSGCWVLAVPCQSQRSLLMKLRHLLGPKTVLVNVAKGIELDSLQCLSQVVGEALGCNGGWLNEHYAVLSGPSFALEVAQGKPAAVVLACARPELALSLRDTFATQRFRCYASSDVRGVEIGGAVKNVIAIASGVGDGLGLGDNARAALVTRGLAEIIRLGMALGANAGTFMGLSGLGDLMLTCAGDLSRNRQLGLRLGAGENLEDILGTLSTVAEGIPTTHAVCALARTHGVEMPIADTCARLLQGRISAQKAAATLLERSPGEELSAL